MSFALTDQLAYRCRWEPHTTDIVVEVWRVDEETAKGVWLEYVETRNFWPVADWRGPAPSSGSGRWFVDLTRASVVRDDFPKKARKWWGGSSHAFEWTQAAAYAGLRKRAEKALKYAQLKLETAKDRAEAIGAKDRSRGARAEVQL